MPAGQGRCRTEAPVGPRTPRLAPRPVLETPGAAIACDFYGRRRIHTFESVTKQKEMIFNQIVTTTRKKFLRRIRRPSAELHVHGTGRAWAVAHAHGHRDAEQTRPRSLTRRERGTPTHRPTQTHAHTHTHTLNRQLVPNYTFKNYMPQDTRSGFGPALVVARLESRRAWRAAVCTSSWGDRHRGAWRTTVHGTARCCPIPSTQFTQPFPGMDRHHAFDTSRVTTIR